MNICLSIWKVQSKNYVVPLIEAYTLLEALDKAKQCLNPEYLDDFVKELVHIEHLGVSEKGMEQLNNVSQP